MIEPEFFKKNPEVSDKTKKLIELFVSSESKGRRFLFGRNEYSAKLADIFEVDGFVDDFTTDREWKEKPVFRGNELPKDAMVVNCSMAIQPVTAHRNIHKLRISDVLSYSDFLSILSEMIPYPSFVQETQEDFIKNQREWEKLEEVLYDQESKEVLNDLLKYRLTGNYFYMNKYSFRPEEQYFEDFLELKKGEVFLDAGGFDGDTTELFCNKNPDYSRVFLFEPEGSNLEKAKTRLKKFQNIDFIPLGVSNKKETLRFNADKGSASAITSSGNVEIQVTTIDQLIDSTISFIKMDLEGWELKALEGSKKHILRDHPKLAIAVYHHPSHFWKIYGYIYSLRKDYKIFLRHYTEGWTETIMYFVPR